MAELLQRQPAELLNVDRWAIASRPGDAPGWNSETYVVTPAGASEAALVLPPNSLLDADAHHITPNTLESPPVAAPPTASARAATGNVDWPEPIESAPAGAAFLFTAFDPKHGYALWKRDGDKACLIRSFPSDGETWPPSLADDASRSAASRGPATVRNLVAFNERIYFTAVDRECGQQVWSSDGTENGTVRATAVAGAGPGAVGQLTASGRSLFFTVVRCDGVTELRALDAWHHSRLLGEFRHTSPPVVPPPLPHADPYFAAAAHNLIDIDQTLYFAGDTGETGLELWKSDGTVAGTIPVRETKTAPLDSPAQVEIETAPLEVHHTAMEVTEGQKFNRVLASFRDPAGLERHEEFTARIAWGDGEESSGSVVRDGPRLSVAGEHVYSRFGTVTAQIALMNGDDSIAVAESRITVHDAALSAERAFPRGTAGRRFNGPVASVRDSNSLGAVSDISAEIDWGDGATSAAIIESDSDGGFRVLGAHVYKSAAEFAIDVRIMSAGGSTASVRSVAKVQAARLIARGITSAAPAFAETPRVVAAFTDGDRNAQAGWYTVQIDWGDETTPGTVEADGHGGFRVIGTHRVGRPGVHSVRVTIQDHAGNSATTTGTVRVISAAA